MKYKETTLTFEDDQIYYHQEDIKLEVMMDWEDELMKTSADYVCSNGGDILELGFGMGISAGYIQANNINSHTIVENHPQVIEKLKIWAENKSNVIIIEGDWYDMKDSLSTYNGIFYDTFGEDDWDKFGIELPSLVKPGAKVTWWNNKSEQSNIHNIDGVEYQAMSVNPPKNNYFNSNTYYLPKKQF
jgi:protein arginine N-methyltransferase 2